MSDPPSAQRQETPSPAPAALPPFRARRLLWLLLPLLLWVAGRLVPLPGVDTGAIFSAPGSPDLITWNLFEVSILSLVGGHLIVEIAAALVPPWRPLRHSPRGRARLTLLALAASFLFALWQGWLIVSRLADLEAIIGPFFIPLLSLLAATAICWAAVHKADRSGAGSSLGLLLGLAGALSLVRTEYVGSLSHSSSATSPDAWTVPVLSLVAAVATVIALRMPTREISAPGGRGAMSIPTPASGLLPFFIGAPLLTGLSPALLSIPGIQWLFGTSPIVVAGLLALLLPWVFYWPSSVATSWARLFEESAAAKARAAEPEQGASRGGATQPDRAKRREVTADTAYAPPGEGHEAPPAAGAVLLSPLGMAAWTAQARRLLMRAMLPAIVYLAVVAWPAWPVLDRTYSSEARTLGAAGLCLLVAAIFDIAAEARFRLAHRDATSVLATQRRHAADAAVAALGEAGIPAFARNAAVRAMLAFCAPFAPIEILVPLPLLERARERLAAVLEAEATGDEPADKPSAAPEDAGAPPKPRLKKRRKAER